LSIWSDSNSNLLYTRTFEDLNFSLLTNLLMLPWYGVSRTCCMMSSYGLWSLKALIRAAFVVIHVLDFSSSVTVWAESTMALYIAPYMMWIFRTSWVWYNCRRYSTLAMFRLNSDGFPSKYGNSLISPINWFKWISDNCGNAEGFAIFIVLFSTFALIDRFGF